MEDYEELKEVFGRLLPSLMRGGLTLSREDVLIQAADGCWRVSVALAQPTPIAELRRYARTFLKGGKWKLVSVVPDAYVLSLFLTREVAAPVQRPASRKAAEPGRQDHLRRQTPVPATTRSPTQK